MKNILVIGLSVLIVISLTSPLATVGAGDEPTTIYGNGWKEIRYADGTVIHTNGVRTFQRWDGEWRPWGEWNSSYVNVSGELIADGGNFKSIFYQHKNTIITDKFSFSQQPSALRFLNIETKEHAKIMDASAASQITMQGNKLIYEDVYPNVDYKFTYDGVKLKEDIVSHRTNYPDSPYPLNKTYLVFSTKLWEFSGIHKLIDDDGEIAGDKDVKGILKLKDINEDVLSYLPIGDAHSTFQINETYNETRSTKVRNRVIKVSGTWYLFSGINYSWVKEVNRTGDIVIDPTWVVGSGGNAWSGNVTHNGTTEVQCTGYIELRQEVDDYISYWRMDKGTGNTAYDQNETSNNDGTLNNMDANDWVSGYYGNYALDFDGSNDYVDCGNDASLNIIDAITIEAWVKFANLNEQGVIVAKKNSWYGSAGYYFEVKKGVALDYVRILGGGSNIGSAENIGWDLNWHHVVGTISGTTATIYFDGVNKTTDSVTSALTATTADLHIGNAPFDGEHFNGTIDEVRIYNRALSNDEINQSRDNEHHTSGNLTSWHDADSGNKTYKISVNFTFPANTNASINLYNNDTGAFIENLATHTTTTNWNATITSAIQDSKANITLYGNISQTPEVHNITYHTQASATPPTPINLANTTGNFWVNYTWDAGSGNVTNGYNVSNGTVWANNTNTYYNESVDPSEWVNITVYAWNSSGSGTMSAGSVSDQVQVSAADTTFTVSLPVGYTKPVFEPPNSTATNYPPNGQTDSQEFFNVTNSGNVNLDVRMRLNTTVSTITLKADADNNPTGADTIGTSLVTIHSNLGQGSSADIWLWSTFDHTPAQTANRTIYINVSQS